MFVAPRLNDDQAINIICTILFGVGQNLPKFLKIMSYLVENQLFRLRISRTIEIDYSRCFSFVMDDSSPLIMFRFTIGQLQRLTDALRLTDILKTDQDDKTS